MKVVDFGVKLTDMGQGILTDKIELITINEWLKGIISNHNQIHLNSHDIQTVHRSGMLTEYNHHRYSGTGQQYRDHLCTMTYITSALIQ